MAENDCAIPESDEESSEEIIEESSEEISEQSSSNNEDKDCSNDCQITQCTLGVECIKANCYNPCTRKRTCSVESKQYRGSGW